jgi:GNAT superfamily N-acetyltransferase
MLNATGLANAAPERAASHFDFTHEPFDSEVLGLRVGRLAAASASSRSEYRALFESIARTAREQGYDQILRRTSLQTFAEIWALEQARFELMDVGVTFARTLRGAIAPRADGDLRVGPSTAADMEAIADAMVSQPWGSRYEADPAYDPACVQELRRRWLWNSHRGRADVVLVGSLDGRPAGYVTCRLDPHGPGEIELVGTLPAFRGRGVASGILAHALAWFSTRAATVTVRTQATNVAAASLYERSGFTLCASDLTFRLALTDRGGDRS